MFLADTPIWMPTARDLGLFSPELVLVATLVMLLAVPLVVQRNSFASGGIAFGGAVLAILFTLNVRGRVEAGAMTGLAPESAGTVLLVDNFSVFFKLFLMFFLACVIFLWLLHAVRRESAAPEFFTLLVGSALGMVLMVSSLNLLMLLIAIELASLPSYAIVGFHKRSRIGAEASLKYVVFGGVSAAIMLYGISLLYGYYHTFDLGLLAQRVMAGVAHPNLPGEPLIASVPNPVLAVGLLCLLVGIGFKISAVPFHFWCPDVFEGASTEVTLWLSVASKAAGLGLLMRIVYTFANPAGMPVDTQQIVAVLGPLAWGIGIIAAITCTWANFVAFRQDNVKRLLAYSSIAHAGYMLMAGAILVNVDRALPGAITALIIYLVIYLFMNLGAFGVVMMVEWETGGVTLDAYTGLIRRAPWLAVPMCICLFSLVGMPPFGGFIAKWWLLFALAEGAQTMPVLLWSLILIAVINTFISLFYYLKIVWRMILRDDGQPALFSPFGGLVLVNACAIILLLTGTILAPQLKPKAQGYSQNLFLTPSSSRVTHVENVANGLSKNSDQEHVHDRSSPRYD